MMTLGTRWARFAGIGLLALASAGCGPKGKGAVGPEGYSHSDYGYRVLATPEGSLLDSDWKLDNFYEKQGGLFEKDAKDYVTTYELDFDGDGTYETQSEEHIYDLRFKHLRHDGVIFIRTIPLSTDQAKKKLSVLLDRYVEAIAGAGYEVVQLNPGASMLVEKRYAASIVSEGKARLAGRDAYAATIDVANIDQIKVDPNARKKRVQLVIAHAPFRYKKMRQDGDTQKFPVIILAGYANQPDEFDEALPEFHDLLNRLEVKGVDGFALTKPSTENAMKPAPTRPAPAATPKVVDHSDEPKAAAPASVEDSIPPPVSDVSQSEERVAP